MHIDATFDSGNIVVVSATDPRDIQLTIRPEPPTQTPDGPVQFYQWFHFRLTGARGTPCTIRILQMDRSAYPDGWPAYRACASTDRQTWRRVPTRWTGTELVIEVTPTSDVIWFAYFAPYDLTRHAWLVGKACAHPDVRMDVLGHTLDGRSMDRLTIGDPRRDVRKLWLIARQHPGESMAEWWMEGFLDRLLDPADAAARQLRERATLYVVPNMNPDGSFRGHLRTNAAGANLNREWLEPTATQSPEVLAVRDAMDATGVDLCLDVHGDEGLPYNFIAGAEGIPSWSDRLASLQDRFTVAYERANPDFQRKEGYALDAPRSGNMTMCTNQIAERFDCLSLTLEMPFKDNANAPDEQEGWSPARSKRLGASIVHPLLAVLDDLR